MKTHVLHRILSYCSARRKRAVTTGEQVESIHECVSPIAPFGQQPRREQRLALRRICSYEMIQGQGLGDEESIVTHQGEAFALNICSEGILLLMDQTPQVQQLLEIHTLSSKRSHVLTLFEVCWSRQIQFGMHGSKCLVGCKLTFGPSPYFLFQRKSLEHSIPQPVC